MLSDLVYFIGVVSDSILVRLLALHIILTVVIAVRDGLRAT